MTHYFNKIVIGMFLSVLLTTGLVGKPVQEKHIEVELISEQESIQPGVPFWLAVRFKMEAHWHIYWKNAGDSGRATILEWRLPKGFKAEAVQWPSPETFKIGPIVTYGYQNEILLMSKIIPPKTLKSGTQIELGAMADWLICSDICLPPTDVNLKLSLPVRSELAKVNVKWAKHFSEARNRLPVTQSGWKLKAGRKNGKIYLLLDQSANFKGSLSKLHFFPYEKNLVHLAGKQLLGKTEEGYALQLDTVKDSKTMINQLKGVLIGNKGWFGDPSKQALEVDLPIDPKFENVLVISLLLDRKDQGINHSKGNRTVNKDELNWEPFSPERVEALRKAGKPVFIDFTASWCLTCQYNESTTLTDPKLVKKFKALGIVTLKADFTTPDEVISKELKKFKRAGVPLYVYYGKDPKVKPFVFPELINTTMVLEAVEGGKEPPNEQYGFMFILLLSFLGGLILNVMPCVFPVLSIKVLSFVEQAGESKAKIRLHGLVFALGILLSFWVLAGIIIAGGAQGWGFQLQSAPSVIGLSAFLFLFGLNLLGVFEIGTSLTRAGQATSGKSGLLNSFFVGVLATVVGAPCIGPFMGIAAGVALVDPVWWKALTIFTFIAVGMAFPYLLLSFYPALLRFVPRPGPWMESFKQFMGFLLLATVALLLWLLVDLLMKGNAKPPFTPSVQTGIGIALLTLILLSIGAWIYGRWGTIVQSFRTRTIARIISLTLVIGILAFAIIKTQNTGQKNTLKVSKQKTQVSRVNEKLKKK